MSTMSKVARAEPITRRLHGQVVDHVSAITDMLEVVRTDAAAIDTRIEDLDERLARLDRETRLLTIRAMPSR